MTWRGRGGCARSWTRGLPGPVGTRVPRGPRRECVRGGEPTGGCPRWLSSSDTSTPPGRLAGVIARAYAALAATRVARYISRHVNWKIDPLLLRVTGGRLATTLVFPTAVLETRGARSGARRRNATIYFHDGERVTIAASNAGSSRHPAWYHNLRAHPHVTFGGIPMRATVVDDERELDRLWGLADRVFPAFPSYRRNAATSGRSIPIVQLTPRESHLVE